MDMGPKCSMHMLWCVRMACLYVSHGMYGHGLHHRNTQIEDTCIVFKQWHISSRFFFALSFLAIILISLGYEYLREYQRMVDRRIALAISRKTRGKGSVSGRSTPEQSGPEVEEVGLLSGSLKISTWYTPHYSRTLVTSSHRPSARRFRSTLAFYAPRSMAFRSSSRSS